MTGKSQGSSSWVDRQVYTLAEAWLRTRLSLQASFKGSLGTAREMVFGKQTLQLV